MPATNIHLSMMSPILVPRISSTLPSWSNYIGLTATIFGVSFGLLRFLILGRLDPIHCDALLNKGSWLDSGSRNWQPDGCMLHRYTPEEGFACLGSRELIFIGDSITRKLFYQFAHILDPSLPLTPPDDEHKHSDHILNTDHATRLTFFWDPFLNNSIVNNVIVAPDEGIGFTEKRRPALLVLGSGLWYLRYANTSNGISGWEANMAHILDVLAHNRAKPADNVIISPVEQIIPDKLSPERAMHMRSSDIDAMNAELYRRVSMPPVGRARSLWDHSATSLVALPMVFNQMLKPSLTEDGLHFSDSVVAVQANILLNFRCNDMLPKRFPLNKTCCSRYPRPTLLQAIVLGLSALWGPYVFFVAAHSTDQRASSDNDKKALSGLTYSAAICLIYLADRTGLWLKEHKQSDAWIFGLTLFTSLGGGLFTVRYTNKDQGFLNREQTDEWKGWMQIAILIYHYFGASKIVGIYNPVRVLVASYLFMTGYGHTIFYLRKADFSFLRVAQVMIRLNLLTLLLAYTMNTDYLSYYFAPLVSMWFLVIYCTMALGAQFNDRLLFLICKCLLSASFMTWVARENWPMEVLFQSLERVCGIHWSAHEWTFRIALDLWIVYVGMFTAIAVIKIREHRLVDHPYWASTVKLSIGVSIVIMVWFLVFEVCQESKHAYNLWHPFISFLPVLAFVVLRNSSVMMRSGSCRAFAFVGRCSLETFIIQYHYWLAGDTKGVLVVIPGTRPINLMVTTIMFLYLCDRVAQATGNITAWICGVRPASSLPTIARNEPSCAEHFDETALISTVTDSAPKPVRATLVILQFCAGWNPGLKTKLAFAGCVMWLINMAWTYP